MLASLVRNLTRANHVRAIHDGDKPTLSICGFSDRGGTFIGYGCASCEKLVAYSADNLAEYLKVHKMICKYKDYDKER